MAAGTQPGSRAGLITALVIFVLLFFIAAIFAVVKYNESEEKALKLKNLEGQYDKIVRREAISGTVDEVDKLRQANEAYREMTFVDIARQERDKLAAEIAGVPAMSTADAITAAKSAIAAANKRLEDGGAGDVKITGGAVIGGLQTLADAIVARKAAVDDRQKAIGAKEAELAAQIKAHEGQLNQLKTALAAAEAKATDAAKAADDYRTQKDAQIAELEKNQVADIEAKKTQIAELDTQIKELQADLEKRQKETTKVQEALAIYRPTNLADASIRRPDGQIIQVNKNSVVFINLGHGQQVAKGMTFEVYDRNEGIPMVGATPEDPLPVGKASLEVVNVGPGSSECRVIRTTAGAQVGEGDIIANLVYDPNVKWHFKVYGDFDLNQDGMATPAEADIVKRLIVEWGGTLTEEINIDTDFVIMGREPVLPNYTKEQREESPIVEFEYQKAEAALKAYDDVKNSAVALHIPVLNQNRFLYMIGFFDQARK